MKNLNGKTLLLLEGNALAKVIIEKAHELGARVIIANWYSVKDAPAKAWADKAIEVNIFDIPAMLKIIKDEHVDGIFTAYTDSHLHIYEKICKEAKLPCFTTEQLCDTMVDKAIFKKYCREAGLPVIDEYELDCMPNCIDSIEFPVIIKPVDNSGARGISICHDKSTLSKAIDRGLEFSKSKKIIIERYLRGDYCLADFMIQDGQVFFCATSDKPANDDDKNNVNLPGAYIFPSKNNNAIKDALLEGVKKFVDIIGYKNGLLCLELINSNGKIYIIEAQFRLGAKYQDVFLQKEQNVDQLAMLLSHALTGKMCGENLENLGTPFKNHYVLMNILLKKGTISKIQDKNEVDRFPNVDEYIPMKSIGDVIEPDGSMIQRFGKVALSARSREELLSSMRYFQENLKIYDENGENMVINSLDKHYT